MATTTLSDLWVHLASDLSEYVRVYMGSLQEDTGISGEVRRYANGVSRSITSVGTVRQVEVELPYLARADLNVLEGWAGRPVMVRDPLGRKVFGVFFRVETSEQPIGDVTAAMQAAFTLSALTLSEEV